MNQTGICSANILLPQNVDMTSWATIACDQFTSEKQYWDKLNNFVAEKKSTLKLVLPEIYLDGTEDERIKKINQNIKKYLENNVFKEYKNCFILTVRKTPFVERRIGLIGTVDLEKYDYSKNSSSLIRATEGTIEERIPPRLKIRQNADVEFPHVMVLFDDEKKEINEELYKNRNNYKKLYDFDLNMGGGKIEGYLVPETDKILEKFSALLNDDRLIKKYGKADKFQFAVGDGNHSLATAKRHWDNLKNSLSPSEIFDHPARYALVEFNNIYDDGIYFEPIYRFIKNIDVNLFLSKLNNILDSTFYCYFNKQKLKFCSKSSVPQSILKIDNFIKEFISSNKGNVDYVHGEQNVLNLVDENKNSVAILFDSLKKEDLFKYVSNFGALPRKTFSMGEGIEKRYYLEGRKIVR